MHTDYAVFFFVSPSSSLLDLAGHTHVIRTGEFSFSREWACVSFDEVGGLDRGEHDWTVLLFVLVLFTTDGKCWHCVDG